MLKEILEAIQLREEQVPLGGQALTVRELPNAAELGADKNDPNIFYKLMIACTFVADGSPAFDEADIASLKNGSRKKLAPLVRAVQRVNGLDTEDETKKPEAVQA